MSGQRRLIVPRCPSEFAWAFALPVKATSHWPASQGGNLATAFLMC
eukprot:CAMPEP_0194773990 /NCGR_PEP_ID=MMETSP0323_2-20130528/56398_1 /TAXON_ID=2866 ORGANISM="Crypthecodinium cohnii, Strain Seligo" /NCGR_SAMPLE_ID=MMETSP0323_2 /ASSEMBLY_ACC=CAM_ASM_000346 /LENGTH=45 /DNA_ID= /DNA_START= /DNA_END= /DNA_ORIENTATION=